MLIFVVIFLRSTMKKSFKLKKTHATGNAHNPALDWDDFALKAPKGKAMKMFLGECTLESPIMATPQKRTECPHEHSSMVSSDPRLFTRFPYRASVMTLLRKVETKSTDSAANRWTGKDPVSVYAGFQNHWYPALNYPVLTVVGCCNTILQPPMVTRDQFEYANVTVFASTSRQQQMVQFKIPLIQLIDQAVEKVVVEVVAAVDLDDHLTTYLIHAGKDPLAMIKMFNLSASGCRLLHLQSVYQLPRRKTTDELHLLGLSGARTTTFQLSFPYLRYPIMELLEELDLQAIGFRTKHDSRPSFSREDFALLPSPVDRNLLTRMTPQKSPYRHPTDKDFVVVPPRETHWKGRIPVKPYFYPPAIHHKPGMPFGKVKPVLFPAGFQTYRHLSLDGLVTVKDIAEDLAYTHGDYLISDGIKILARTYGIDEDVVKEFLHESFQEFHKKNDARRFKKTNLPYYIRSTASEVMPEEWIHSTKHKSVFCDYDRIRTIEEGQMLPYRPDDAEIESAVSEADFDLISPAVIDENFWFPADHPINNLDDETATIQPPQTNPMDLSMNKTKVTLEDVRASQQAILDEIREAPPASPVEPPRKQVKKTPLSDSRKTARAVKVNVDRQLARAIEMDKFLKSLQLPEGTDIVVVHNANDLEHAVDDVAEPADEATCMRNELMKEGRIAKMKKTAIESIINADKEIAEFIEHLHQHGVVVTEIGTKTHETAL